MQQDPIATSSQHIQTGSNATTTAQPDNGSLPRDASRSGGSTFPYGGQSPARRSPVTDDGARTPSTSRNLSDDDKSAKPKSGQRITDYERALMRSPGMPQQPLGFKVVRRPDGSDHLDGAQLMDLPNEVLTRIVTQLRPDARAAASMVCKRLREVIMTPYAWQLAFVQHFPGENHNHSKEERSSGVWDHASDLQVSYQQPSAFARTTPQATWRSEFLLRSELMQGLSLGRPGIGKESGPGWYYKKARKSQGTLIYYPRRSRILSHLHVIYGKETGSRAIHGSSDAGLVSVSDPSNGRVDRWGDEDDFDARLVDDLSEIELYGMGDRSLLIVPNPMDVSAAYGRVGGEGYPRGRAFFRGVHANTQRVNSRTTGYLIGGHVLGEECPEIPDVADLADGISSVWLAKSSEVPATTRSMVGILTGTTSGIITAYSLAPEGSPKKSSLNGCITARWALSPGVPIIAFQIDDQYSVRRRRQGRIWAVALNALGEVFYLDTPPIDNLDNVAEKTHMQLTADAWETGRTTPWKLVKDTCRSRKDGAILGEDETRTFQPPSGGTTPSTVRLKSDVSDVNRLCRLPYWHFRETYNGWDMQRRLEVDFSSDDGNGAGELIFLLGSGMSGCGPARVQRFTRSLVKLASDDGASPNPKDLNPLHLRSSIFGRTPSELTTSTFSSGTSSPTPDSRTKVFGATHSWILHEMSLAGYGADQITASTIDKSFTALMTFSEDPLLEGIASTNSEGQRSPLRAIPGGRARNLVVGTSTGAVLVWNGRAQASNEQPIKPLRAIQTTSKEITALAATAIYIVHGGSDGLAQAWDPLASTLEPLHTIHNKNTIRPSRNTNLDGRRLTKEDMNVVRAISVDPNPLLLRGCLTCGPGIHSWSFRSQDNVVKRKRRMKNIHGRPVNRRNGAGITDYIAGEQAEVKREQKERAAEFERLQRNFGLGELTEEEAIVYAQMLSQEAAEAERQRDEQLLLQSESEAELAFLSRRSSHDDEGSDDTASVDTGYMTSSDVTSSHDPLEQPFGGQSPRATYITSIADDRGMPIYGTVGNENRTTDYPITFKARQGKHRRGKKTTRQGSSSASSTSGDGVGSSGVSGGQHRYYGHNATTSLGSEGDFSVSGLSADEQLALALRLSAVEEEGHSINGTNDIGNSDENGIDFPTLAARDAPGKGKGKAGTAPPAIWDHGLTSTSGMTEEEELALALERSMQAQ